MSIKYIDCKNCEKDYKSDYEYCPYCGQKANDELTLRVLFYNTINNYFSFDARFFRSFIPLLTKPGFLAYKFIEGKRQYLHPGKMYVFIAVIFFFLFSFVQRNQSEELDSQLAETLKKENTIDTIKDKRIRDSLKVTQVKNQKIKDSLARIELRTALQDNKFIHGYSEKQIDSIVNTQDFDKNGITNFDFNTKAVDSLLAIDAKEAVIYKEMGMSDDAGVFQKRLFQQALKFYKSRKGGSILKMFYDTIPVAMFFLLPIFAFILKTLYWRKGAFAYHLVFSLYFFCFLFTVFSIVLTINFIYDIPNWIDSLIIFSTFIYLLIALKHFYKQGAFVTFFKGSVSTFFFLLFVTPLTAVILGLLAFLFY